MKMSVATRVGSSLVACDPVRDGLILAITAHVHDRNTRAAAIQPHAGAYIQLADTPTHTATATPNTAAVTARAE
jgi:hypothetical protein